MLGNVRKHWSLLALGESSRVNICSLAKVVLNLGERHT